MFASFQLEKHPDLVARELKTKLALASEIMGQSPLRVMAPELLFDRSRLDLMWNGEALGLRGPSDNIGGFEFFTFPDDVDTVDEQILNAIAVFKRDPPPLGLSQLRFRVSNSGQIGLWIDTANEEIKALMTERSWLTRSLERGWVIEAGQKRKEFIINESNLSFFEARPQVWLPSFGLQGQEIPVESLIALFSQPGPEANRALISVLLDLADEHRLARSLRWVEWGAGVGNLSAPLFERFGASGAALEIEPAAVALLASNSERFFPGVSHDHGDAKHAPQLHACDLLVIDPPRSGFPELLQKIGTDKRKIPIILATHCHLKGLMSDSQILKSNGYKLQNWSFIDLFPATPHAENVSLWTL